MEEFEFKFVQPGEFDDPYYDFYIEGERHGRVFFSGVQGWYGTLDEWKLYGPKVFHQMEQKIIQLDEALESQRNNFFNEFFGFVEFCIDWIKSKFQ